MVFLDTLNGRNLFTDFGLVIQTGTQNLLCMPERKDLLQNNWREQNGTEYDLTAPVFKDKEVVLKVAFMADDDTDFWQKYQEFASEIQQAGYQNLFIEDHSKTYQVFYKNTTNWQKKSKRLKNVSKVFVKFNLILQVA